MFLWLADVLDGCALPVAAERWRRASASAAAWRVAFQGFVLVRWGSALRAWVAAYLGRHSLQARLCRWAWSAGVLGYLWYDMERLLADPGVAWVPPVIGPLTVYVGAVAWVAYTLRVGGAVALRPFKAAALVAVTFVPIWAGLSVTFHYGWGVAIWSSALWREVVVPGWYRGVNFQWSAFYVWMVFEVAWVVLLGFVWTRAPRAWLAFRKWSVRVLIWSVRYALFVGIFWVGSSLVGRVPEEVLVDLARGVYEVAGGPAELAPPGWAYLLLGGLIAAVVIGILAVVLDVVGELLSVVAKLLTIAMDGGVLRRGVDDVRHIVGFREYARRLDEKASRRVMGYVARRVEAAAATGITADGFQRAHEDESEAAGPAPEPVSAEAATPAPVAPEKPEESVSAGDPDGFDDDDEDGDEDGVSAPVDVPGRDDALAVDTPSAAGGEAEPEADPEPDRERTETAEERAIREEMQREAEALRAEAQADLENAEQAEADRRAQEEYEGYDADDAYDDDEDPNPFDGEKVGVPDDAGGWTGLSQSELSATSPYVDSQGVPEQVPGVGEVELPGLGVVGPRGGRGGAGCARACGRWRRRRGCAGGGGIGAFGSVGRGACGGESGGGRRSARGARDGGGGGGRGSEGRAPGWAAGGGASGGGVGESCASPEGLPEEPFGSGDGASALRRRRVCTAVRRGSARVRARTRRRLAPACLRSRARSPSRRDLRTRMRFRRRRSTAVVRAVNGSSPCTPTRSSIAPGPWRRDIDLTPADDAGAGGSHRSRGALAARRDPSPRPSLRSPAFRTSAPRRGGPRCPGGLAPVSRSRVLGNERSRSPVASPGAPRGAVAASEGRPSPWRGGRRSGAMATRACPAVAEGAHDPVGRAPVLRRAPGEGAGWS